MIHRSRRKTFNITYLHGLEDTMEIIDKIWKNIEEFEIFLKLALMPLDAVEKLLSVLNKVVKCQLEGDCITRLLQIVCASQFLDSHLRSYTDHLHKCSRDEEVYSRKAMTDILEQILTLLSNICHSLPSEGPKVYSVMAYMTRGDLINVIKNSEAIAEHFNELLAKGRSSFLTFTTSEYNKDRGRDSCQKLYDEE